MLICKNFFAKLVQSVFLCHWLSKKLNFIKIWQLKVGQNKDLVCYRKKQSFRQCAWGLRQLVLKPGFRPKRRALGILEKSENFNSLRPILFELCKQNYRGGSNWPPPQLSNFPILKSLQPGVFNLWCFILKYNYHSLKIKGLYHHNLRNFKFSSHKICWSTGIKFTLAESSNKFC